eukprot:GHVO01025054.1.p1 GENE.GHVO01025054.1~~GHVO01025054.1.p1  ORF type:complete len:104 (+),score=9.88 GHVO01025054.1:244-555(+)
MFHPGPLSPPQMLHYIPPQPTLPPVVNQVKLESVERAPSEVSDTDTIESIPFVPSKEEEVVAVESAPTPVQVTEEPVRKSRFSVTKVKDDYSEGFRIQQEQQQ